jgi:ABC-type nitrate/sulfonate/bicarbonate transport system substrate-binding protein
MHAPRAVDIDARQVDDLARGSETEKAMTRTITLSAGSGPTFGVDDIACAAATQLGYWAAEGLSVEWVPARGGLAAMRLALARDVDAAYGGLGPALQLRAEGEPLRIVCSMARALAQNLVVTPRVGAVEDLVGARGAVDGIGALSHHMARCVLAAAGIPESDVEWHVAGPPPERIAALLDGSVDASLIRVEEALSLTRDPGNDLSLLLGFTELKRLVPVQPHGVIAAPQRVIADRPDDMEALARGLILASRRLRDDPDAFRAVVEHHVSVPLSDGDIEAIHRQEVASDGFAVDGEMSAAHWDAQIDFFRQLNPNLAVPAREDVLAPAFVARVLQGM